MKKTNICFLLGLAGSGKDTVGNFFVKKGYTRIAFADAAKRDYALFAGADYEKLQHDREYKEMHRSRLIEYAESFRHKDPNYWINKAFEPFIDKDTNQFKPGLKLVITDCRRVSEIDWILNLKKYINTINKEASCVNSVLRHYVDVKLVEINNPSVEDRDCLTHYAIGYAHGIHKGCTNWSSNFIDAIIVNDSTLTELEKKTNECIKYLGF